MDQNFIGMVMGWIMSWFSGQWTTSGASAVDSAMKLLMESPWPALDAAWFKVLWNSFFGLCMLIVSFLAIPRVVAYAFDMRSGDRIGEVCMDVLKMFLIGVGLLVSLAYGMQLVDLIGKMLLAITTGGSNATDWYKPLMTITGIQGLWGGLFLAFVGMCSSTMLWFETMLVQQAMYVFAILFMAAYSFKRWRLGQWFKMGASAGLKVTLMTKIFEIGWLGPWSIVLKQVHMDQATAAVLSMVVVVVAAWLPFGAFIGLLVHEVKTHGRVEIEGKVRTENSFDGSYNSRELNSRQSSSMLQSASRSGELVRGATVATGVALATLAVQRGGDWMAKKALIAGQPGVAAALKGGSKAASWMTGKALSGRPTAQKLHRHGTTGLEAVRKYRNRRPGGRSANADPFDE